MFITLYCTFFSCRCTTAMGNFPILRTCVMEYVNMTQKFPFSFSKLRYGPFDFNPRKFKIKMELNNIDEG